MSNILIEAKEISKYFPVRKGILGLRKMWLKAVDNISLKIRRGETLGLVGESGSGKSTLGRILAGILRPTKGTVKFRGIDLYNHEARKVRRRIQLIFQNPDSSLNPRMKVRDVLAEAVWASGINEKDRINDKVIELLNYVGLNSEVAERYPHQLSGGMKQRIAIARALAVNPEFVIADEIVSSLDVSIKAQILNLMIDLQDRFNLTCLFISHDLPVVGYVSDRIMVMYLGKIMEILPAKRIFEDALHPYTRALLTSVPSLYLKRKEKVLLSGEISSPINLPPGCRLSARCPYANKRCKKIEPELKVVENDHFVACHLYS